MQYDLEIYLKDLENRIDPATEEKLYQAWQCFADGEVAEDTFAPRRPELSSPSVEWPHIMVNDTLDDIDAMILQQLEICSGALEAGTGELLSFRSNFGTGIIPSMFGAELFEVDYELDTLPCCRELDGGKDAIRELIAKGVPNLEAGMGSKVLAVAKRFQSIRERYPKIGRYVHIYVPDTQGPLAICEILWGSNLYMDVFLEPDLVHQLMDLATETFIAFTDRWFELVPPVAEAYAVNWGLLHKGHVLIRNDAAMNISPDMYASFAKPYDQRILNHFDGGVIHFCGRGDHYVHFFKDMPGVHAINMSQPECNDMSVIYNETIDQGIQIIGMPEDEVERSMKAGIHYNGQVHCGAAISAWLDEEKVSS